MFYYFCLHNVVQQPAAPDVNAQIINGPTSINLTWTQPLSGGNVDSYTVQYNASVRNCSVELVGPMTISSTVRRFEITNLKEDSEVSVIITAINIRGSNSTLVNTNTLTASMYLHQFTKAQSDYYYIIHRSWYGTEFNEH